MIIGTAGHIDHGKTALVRALTGVETDRIAAEKERGISIELGYAYLPIPEQERRLGFIDVPGHEALVHTMVAGATGIDFALLVVAADDGVMPQTREHLAILGLLGVQRGCVVLTKIDQVDETGLRRAEAQLQNVLQDTFLAQAPIFSVNSMAAEDKSGVPALRQYLFEQALQHQRPATQELFRLAIDRAFTLSGHGTVVTGTVFSGRFDLDKHTAQSSLVVMPGRARVRVRGIHAQNQPSATALTGQRCAINLAGIAAEDIQRGQWLADERCFQPSRRIDVRMHMLGSSTTELQTWSPAHIHLGAGHYHAHCVPLTTPWVQPRDQALVQLVFDEPICVLPGDRFIVRDAQARHTIAGGVVIDPRAPDRKRRSQMRIDWLEATEQVLAGASIEKMLALAPYGLSRAQLRRLPTNTPWWQPSALADARWIGDPADEAAILISQTHWQSLTDKILSTMAWAHQRYPDDPGVERARLRRMVAPRAPDLLWDALLAALLSAQELALNGAWYHLPTHSVTLDAQEERLAQEILQRVQAGRFDPPWIRDIARQIDADEAQLRQIARKLVRQGRVYQVVNDLYYAPGAIIELAQILQRVTQSGGVRVAAYRDQLNLGRKRTIQILEFFERIGFSRRVGDIHYLRQDSRFLEQLADEN